MILPTPKMERWKYTNLPAKLKKFDLRAGELDVLLSAMPNYVQLFGEYSDDLPDWVREMLARPAPGEEKYHDMMLWQAANDALKNGFVLDVPENTKGEEELKVTSFGHEDTETTARQIIRVGENAEFTVMEYQSGKSEYWSNIVTQIDLAKGARLKHYRIQENAEQAVVTQNTHVVMAEGAEYESFSLVLGANLSRNQIHVDMEGEQGACRLSGVNLLEGSRLADTTVTVEHKAPNCRSSQNYRSVATDKSVGVFQGKIHVHKEAQKTDGYQMAKSLLLSQQATINVKPELEIYADDVKCSHGATTGQLDEEALFYLRSRGIPEAEARDLLVQAFLSEVIDGISNENIRNQATEAAYWWLK